MTSTLPHTNFHDGSSELTASFARQLATTRQRLAELRHVRGPVSTIERRCLFHQEAAWHLGLLLLRRAPSDDPARIIDLLDANARHGGPAGETFAAMAAMIAIHARWLAAPTMPEDHPARDGPGA